MQREFPIQTTIRLTEEQTDWLDRRGSKSEVIRALINRAMQAEKR